MGIELKALLGQIKDFSDLPESSSMHLKLARFP